MKSFSFYFTIVCMKYADKKDQTHQICTIQTSLIISNNKYISFERRDSVYAHRLCLCVFEKLLIADRLSSDFNKHRICAVAYIHWSKKNNPQNDIRLPWMRKNSQLRVMFIFLCGNFREFEWCMEICVAISVEMEAKRISTTIDRNHPFKTIHSLNVWMYGFARIKCVHSTFFHMHPFVSFFQQYFSWIWMVHRFFSPKTIWFEFLTLWLWHAVDNR